MAAGIMAAAGAGARRLSEPGWRWERLRPRLITAATMRIRRIRPIRPTPTLTATRLTRMATATRVTRTAPAPPVIMEMGIGLGLVVTTGVATDAGIGRAPKIRRL